MPFYRRRTPYKRTSYRTFKRRTYAGSSGRKGRIYPAQRGYVRRTGLYGRFTKPNTPELKFIDFGHGPNVLTAAGIFFTSLNQVPQGAGAYNRVGSKIHITKIHVHGRLYQSEYTGGSNASQRVRLIMFQDTQVNGNPPTTSNAVLATPDVYSFQNLGTTDRFKILKDITLSLNRTPFWNGSSQVSPEYQRTVNFSVNTNITVTFDPYGAATGDISTIRDNNIGLLGISESGDVSFMGTSRIRFYDM